MRFRHPAAALCGVTAIVALLSCSSFGATDGDPTAGSLPPSEAGTLDGAVETNDSASCTPHIRDAFERENTDVPGAVGWTLEEARGGALILGDGVGRGYPARILETRTPGPGSPPHKARTAYLVKELVPVPKSLKCSFLVRRHTAQTSSVPSYVDIFQVVARHRDKVVRLRLGFDETAKLRIRDDHFSDDPNETCVAENMCPLSTSPEKPGPGGGTFSTDVFTRLTFATDFRRVTVTQDSSQIADFDFGIRPPQSAAIDFGLANYSEHPQSASFADVVCEFTC